MRDATNSVVVRSLSCRGSTNTEPGAVATGSTKRGVHPHSKLAFSAIHEMEMLFIASPTRSHPPPHAGCPRGDPGPLPVLYSSTHNANILDRQIHTPIEGSEFTNPIAFMTFVQSLVSLCFPSHYEL